MKGIILAGGAGTRMYPCTKVTNKHLLPAYDRPILYYPIQTLVNDAGIKDIIIATGGNSVGDIINLLGDGSQFGAKLSYVHQSKPGGIAYALGLCKDIVGNDDVLMILGDNVFSKINKLSDIVAAHKETKRVHKTSEAWVFLKDVADPERFGVAEIENKKLVGIEEKPTKPKSNLAVTGLYLYPNDVFDVVKTLKPSKRGELEITDVNNYYIAQKRILYYMLDKPEKIFWHDAGTFDSMLATSNFVYNNKKMFHENVKE